MTVIAIEINNRTVSRDVPSRMHLADFVRDEGRQTGTHLGCEHGVCGACTLLVDGQPVRSCITFAVACDGKKVTTVEGYGDDAIMALLRPAFSRHHGLQCGFCTPGMLATARDIVLRFPNADEHLIRVELSGNLCRCTGYMGIVNAVMDVLEQCRDDAVPGVSKLRAASTKVFKDVTVVAGGAVGFQTFKATDIGKVAVVAEKQAAPDDNVTAVKGGTSIQGSFKVPYPADAVWKFMADLPAVAGCLPGAELTEHIGDRVKGRVAIKFGPMSASFNGAARLDRNDQARSAVLKGAGQDSISKSRANGDVSYRMVEIDANATKVEVDLLYSLQGPLAQFSRSGLVKDFVGRLIQEFGKNVTLRMNPNRSSDLPLPPAKLNAFGLGLSVIWSRIKRLFGRGG
jgi:carbon-monoxide dehydrogenase small subunit